MAKLRASSPSSSQTPRTAGLAIVTGDTKVVPQPAADKLFI
ncbi:hydrogenase expression/formation protein HypE, partial [Escherichia coli]